MDRKFNLSVAFAVTALGALPWPAAAQAPPRDNYKSSIWSSQDRMLYELDLLTSLAFDELLPVRSSSLEIEALNPRNRRLDHDRYEDDARDGHRNAAR